MEISIKFGGGRRYAVRVLSPGTHWYLRTFDALADQRGVISRAIIENRHVSSPAGGGRVIHGAALLQEAVKNRLLHAAEGNLGKALDALRSNAYTLDEELKRLLAPVYASLNYQRGALNVRRGWNGEGFFTRRFSKKGKCENDPHLKAAQAALDRLERAFAALGYKVSLVPLLPAPQ